MTEITKLEDLDKEKEQGVSYNIDKITDKIYLGSIKGLSEVDYLQKENIDSILSIINESPKVTIDKNINHKTIDINKIFLEYL